MYTKRQLPNGLKLGLYSTQLHHSKCDEAGLRQAEIEAVRVKEEKFRKQAGRPPAPGASSPARRARPATRGPPPPQLGRGAIGAEEQCTVAFPIDVAIAPLLGGWVAGWLGG